MDRSPVAIVRSVFRASRPQTHAELSHTLCQTVAHGTFYHAQELLIISSLIPTIGPVNAHLTHGPDIYTFIIMYIRITTGQGQTIPSLPIYWNILR